MTVRKMITRGLVYSVILKYYVCLKNLLVLKFTLALKLLLSLAFEEEEEIINSYNKIVEEIQLLCDRAVKESENGKSCRALPLF